MVCRKRGCYDTRNCFIDRLAPRLHTLQFVTWPISIFQADVDKNPSAPHARLHFVMTWRMHGEGGGDREGQPPSSSSCPQSSSSSSVGRDDGGRELRPALPSPLACWPWSPRCLRLSLPVTPAHQGVPRHGGGRDQAPSDATVLTHRPKGRAQPCLVKQREPPEPEVTS